MIWNKFFTRLDYNVSSQSSHHHNNNNTSASPSKAEHKLLLFSHQKTDPQSKRSQFHFLSLFSSQSFFPYLSLQPISWANWHFVLWLWQLKMRARVKTIACLGPTAFRSLSVWHFIGLRPGMGLETRGIFMCVSTCVPAYPAHALNQVGLCFKTRSTLLYGAFVAYCYRRQELSIGRWSGERERERKSPHSKTKYHVMSRYGVWLVNCQVTWQPE